MKVKRKGRPPTDKQHSAVKEFAWRFNVTVPDLWCQYWEFEGKDDEEMDRLSKRLAAGEVTGYAYRRMLEWVRGEDKRRSSYCTGPRLYLDEDGTYFVR